MSKPYCCDWMDATIRAASTCPDAKVPHDPSVCSDVPVVRKGKRYAIPQPDYSYYVIKFCPWCGTDLKTIKRGAS